MTHVHWRAGGPLKRRKPIHVSERVTVYPPTARSPEHRIVFCDTDGRRRERTATTAEAAMTRAHDIDASLRRLRPADDCDSTVAALCAAYLADLEQQVDIGDRSERYPDRHR